MGEVMTNERNAVTNEPNALQFALLIDSVPELTEAAVTRAYLAARAAWARRDDVELERIEDTLRDGVVKTQEEVGDFADDELVRLLGAPVGGRRVVKPTRPANTAALSAAVDRFVEFTNRLPHLGTLDDRQAVWNLLPGRRLESTPVTSCAAAYERRGGDR